MALFIVQFRLTYILTKTSHISIITLQKKCYIFICIVLCGKCLFVMINNYTSSKIMLYLPDTAYMRGS